MRFFIVFLILGMGHARGATPTPITVFTEKAAVKPIFNLLTYPARVESRVNAIVRSESDGAVTKITRPLGAKVRRGEIVAIIKHTDPVYQYAPLNVIASVSGVINDVNVTPGSLVNKGDPIVSITDPDQLRVVVEIAAIDLRSIKAGLKGELTVSGVTEVLSAEVLGLSPSVDPMLGTATCQLQVSLTDQKKIVPGMVGHVQFKVNQRNGYLLPDNAIVYRGAGTSVQLVENGKAKKVNVTIGEKRSGQVEVLSGLKEGDQVINRTSRFVTEGDDVQVETAHE